MPQFLYDADDKNDDAKATIYRDFSENSLAKNLVYLNPHLA